MCFGIHGTLGYPSPPQSLQSLEFGIITQKIKKNYAFLMQWDLLNLWWYFSNGVFPTERSCRCGIAKLQLRGWRTDMDR
jgi:hypothetical protein